MQELCVAKVRHADLATEVLSLPATPLPRLRVLQLSGLYLPSQLDCTLFPALQQLTLKECWELNQLCNLGTCAASLRHLEADMCPQLCDGLDAATLTALSCLQHLVLRDTRLGEVEVPAVSPGLTCLVVGQLVGLGGSVAPARVELACLGGEQRTALRHLGIHGVRERGSWDLQCVPNVETLDISHQRGLPSPLVISRAGLKVLQAKGTDLKGLQLSAAAASLTSLDVSFTPLTSLYLAGCFSLKHLECSGCWLLQLLDLTPVRDTLVRLSATICKRLTQLTAAGCSALQDLNARGCTALVQLDLSGCCSLTQLDVSSCAAVTALDLASCTSLFSLSVQYSGLQQVDVSVCGSLNSVKLHQGQVVVGTTPQVTTHFVHVSQA